MTAKAIDIAREYYREVPTAKWSDLRYGLSGQLEDHDGEAAQA
jgi:hypothetical protein